MEKRRHTLRLSDKEVDALKNRLVPIAPIEYDLETFSILRELYGRLEHIQLNASVRR